VLVSCPDETTHVTAAAARIQMQIYKRLMFLYVFEEQKRVS